MKKILAVCQHYYPENFQITDICEALCEKGYDVTALVGLPNYHSGYVPKEYKKGKKNFEIINGVKVIRCYEIGRRNNKLFLALNYLSFCISSLFKVSKFDSNYDLVLGYETSPITMVSAAKKYAINHKVPFYLFCVDIWPECLKVYIKSENNIIFKIFKKISKSIYSSADKILCTSTSFIEYLTEVHSIGKNKLLYLPQFGDDTLLDRDLKKQDSSCFNLVFMGNIGQEQNLSNVIKALYTIKNENFILHVIGDGSDMDNVKKTVSKLNMNDKVIFYGRKPKNEMLNFYKIADVCVLPLRCNNKIGLTLPNKLQNYMAAGKPILGMISGSAKEIIEESNCGLCVEGNDIEGFARIVKTVMYKRDILQEYSINAKKYYVQNFTKKEVISKLEEIIEG